MTLADVLVSIFIFTIILASITGIFITYKNIYTVEISYNELTINSSILLNKISTTIRQGIEVIETKNINGTDYTTDYDTLILSLATIDSDNNILADTYDYIVYYIDPIDNTILKSNLEADVNSKRTSSTKFEGEFIDTIIFNYNNTNFSSIDKIETVLVTNKIANNLEQEIIMQSTTNLRNN
ncbi:MAG: hypothetical protein ACNFW9_01915 [Candidatus Kerfeldbacteria bacterium]|jgi:hypothetical protein